MTDLAQALRHAFPRRLAFAGVVMAAAAMSPAISPALAADDFNLTYHVERSDADKLSLDDCAAVAEKEAGIAGYAIAAQRFPGQLVVLSGGTPRVGALTVYCIAVEDKTVSVVQGTDYTGKKGRLAELADAIHLGMTKAAK